MTGATGWVHVQQFMESVIEALRDTRPFEEPETDNIFAACAAREAHEHALSASACERVWPFLVQQHAQGRAWVLLGSGATVPAWPSLFTVCQPAQPVGMALDLTIGTVGSARWAVEPEDFSGPEDWLDESEVQHAARHGPFIGCPIVLDRQACKTDLYELRHGRRATGDEIKFWVREMREQGGRPTRDLVSEEYRRSYPGASDESFEAFWRSIAEEIQLPRSGGRSSKAEKQMTAEFLARKPHPET
ncbi:hypothetical protein SAMN04489859_1006165 [Paracoccus alcaliphilus]|uniref:Uncharacterized protein n=1 Tax=Paracoccus alcaliphilus TaxID=34002 RepID=A0A1H8GFL3_9RHOB|nr:hypothetical protein [Paracoccus alcaliphilus]WCR17997.1 hypothetical protein JHW40_17155 [Paracoccus alcaliphilus]SEN42782.1 hypothetical protein SAMN04489859_1006165 [Paracoccus alcaliphilus]